MARERTHGIDESGNPDDDLASRAVKLVAGLRDRLPAEAEAIVRSTHDDPAYVQHCLKLLQAEREFRCVLENNPFMQDLSGLGIDVAGGPGEQPPGLPVGTRLGRYQLLRVLGVGATSHVYAAMADSLKREVALKVLSLSGQRDRRSFAREALALARLRHPDIVKVYDAGQTRAGDTDLGWIAMEIATGVPITVALLDRSVREQVKLMSRVCRAIEYAHQQGVIHRDLKPGHLRVTLAASQAESEAAELRVLDFGVARLLDASELSSLRGMHGTIGYMSPEQLAGDPNSIDVRSDVFALGAILYEILSSEPLRPIAGKSLPQALVAARGCRVSHDSLVRRGIHVDLASVVAMSCADSPPDRYRNAGAMADDLDRWLEGRPVAARRASAYHQSVLWMRRHRGSAALVLFVVAAVLFGAAGLSLSVWQSRQREADVRRERNRLVAAVGLLRTYIRRLDSLGGTLSQRAQTLDALIPLIDLPSLDPNADPELARALADALQSRCDVLEELGDTSSLPGLTLRLIALREGVASSSAAQATDRADAAIAWVLRGDLLCRDDSTAAGRECYVVALRINEALASEHPHDARFLDDLTHGYIRLARASVFHDHDLASCREFLKQAEAVVGKLERDFGDRATTWRTSAEFHLTELELWNRMEGSGGIRTRNAGDAALQSLRRLQAARPGNRHDRELAVWITRNAANNYPRGHERNIEILRETLSTLGALIADDPHRANLWIEYLLDNLQLVESLHQAGRDDEALIACSHAADALDTTTLAVRSRVRKNDLYWARLQDAVSRYPDRVSECARRMHSLLADVQ